MATESESVLQPSLLAATSRTAVFELNDTEGPDCSTALPIYLNDRLVGETTKAVFSLCGLEPDTAFSLRLGAGRSVRFETGSETAALDIRSFGAKSGATQDNTAALAAAVAACPAGGTIVIPAGLWMSGPIFLKSNITLYLESGATLKARARREDYPILPGEMAGKEKIPFWGSWEGRAAPCFASLITGLGINNTTIAGCGVIDGNGAGGDWWRHPKEKKGGGFRPRTIYLNRCNHILIQGLNIRNSPSWTIHPLLCRHLRCLDLEIENPKDAPNTDGLNPESCEDVEIVGTRFSVGDDCIAIKSGRLSEPGRKLLPCRRITIRRCLMAHGHGAVVIGSEMSGGVNNVFISRCLFQFTDRGLRIKTRRGRGKDGIVEDIHLRKVVMRHVADPLVINCFYNCDADGQSDYVQNKAPLPVDKGTPKIRNIRFEAVDAAGAAHAAGFVWGLPEEPIQGLILRDIRVDFDVNALQAPPAMACDVPPMRHRGFVLINVNAPVIENIIAANVDGPLFPDLGVIKK